MKIHSSELAGKISALAEFQEGAAGIIFGLGDEERSALYYCLARENRKISEALQAFDQFIGNEVSPESLRLRVFWWQMETFKGYNTLPGKFAHMEREIKEVLNNPNDLSEWADVFILFVGAMGIQGLNFNQLLAAAASKMDVNEKRQWGPPDSHGVCRHVEPKAGA
jgi:hypothetical protein